MPYTANPVWSLAVNWDQGILERLDWKTDIMGSELGWEQRIPRRLYPRRTFEAGFLLNKEDRQYFNVLASAAGGREMVIPIWHDVITTTAAANAGSDLLYIDTRFREFEVGGLAFVRGPNARKFEVGVVQAVSPTVLQLISNLEYTWPAGTRIYPAKLGRLNSEIRPIKKTDQLATLQAEFQLVTPSPVAASWAPNYKFLPVIRTRPEETDDQEFEYARVMSTLDNLIGAPDYFDVRETPILRQTHAWAITGTSNNYELRKLLYNLKGRAKALWLPTYMSDMTLVAPITAGDTYFDIVNIGITANELEFEGRKDLRIELNDGTVFYREITGYTALSTTVERIALDAPIGSDVPIDGVKCISFMMIARLDQDSVELNHVTDSVGLTRCRLNFVGPTQGTPLTLPLYTSKPYPVDVLDALDVDATLERTLLWSMELHAMDMLPSLVSVSMPTVVAYRTYNPDPEAMDVITSLVSVSMPTVVAYRTYNPDPEAMDVEVSLIGVSMPVVVNYQTYNPDDEAIDVSVSLVGVTLSS